MVRSKRTAFTLVELLVVISIIGMLMAILLPAVGAATESARSAQCKNRMRQMALAMSGFESRNQSFPGYVDGFERGTASIPHSWLVAIMPDMERQDIYDQYGTDGFEAPFLDFLVCPSDPPLTKGPLTSYVANAGLADADAAGCGIAHTAWPIRGDRGKKVIHQKTSLDKISAGDGSSTTILLSENIQAAKWGPEDNRTPEDEFLSFFNESASGVDIPALKNNGVPANVIVFQNDQNPGNGYKVNSKFDNRDRPWSPTAAPTLVNARPSSEHRGGVNVAFADGHVEFLKEDVEYSVYARLLSPDGKKCSKNVSPDRINHTVILSDTDYK